MTMTSNPYWDEIVEQLLLGQMPQDLLEIVERVYRAKLRDVEDFLLKRHHLGRVATWAHVKEF